MLRLLSSLSFIALAGIAQAGDKTVEDRLAQYGDAVRQRLEPHFVAAGIGYPPGKLVLVGLKQERVLEVYAAGMEGPYRFICSYPILAASGDLGPKLQEGDRQVPEGIYCIESLNPNSRFHLSLRLNYPNEADRAQAKRDRRRNLGGDIMIHGDAVSIGCIAVGDSAAEDLFVLAARTGLPNIKVVLSPVDFRRGRTAPTTTPTREWIGKRYAEIKAELAKYPLADAK